MDKKTNIQIQEINRLMIYDRSKTLFEQGEFKPAYGPTWGMATHGKASDFVKAAEDRAEFIHEYRYEIMDVLAIGAIFISVIGPALSLAIDLGNAAMYYHEGDAQTAGLVAAFSIIPFGELVKMVPGVKQGGVDLITKSLQKAKAGKALSKTEQEIIESVVENSSKIARKAKRQFLRKILNEGFKKLSLKEKLAVVYKLVKAYPGMGAQGFGILNQGLIQMGGILLTYAKIISIYGFDGSDPNLDLQKELEKHEDEITDKIIEDLDSTFGTTSEERDDEFIKLLQDAIDFVKNPEVEITDNEEKSGENEEIIITDYDQSWDYKRVGDEYFTKRKSSNKWIKPTGNALNAIKTKVFKN